MAVVGSGHSTYRKSKILGESVTAGQQNGSANVATASAAAGRSLLSDALFPSWSHETSGSKAGTAMDTEAMIGPTSLDPDEMAKQDPLGIQIWRLYSRTKNALPLQERMDNLSWRMMAMNLKKQEREQRDQQERE